MNQILPDNTHSRVSCQISWDYCQVRCSSHLLSCTNKVRQKRPSICCPIKGLCACAYRPTMRSLSMDWLCTLCNLASNMFSRNCIRPLRVSFLTPEAGSLWHTRSQGKLEQGPAAINFGSRQNANMFTLGIEYSSYRNHSKHHGFRICHNRCASSLFNFARPRLVTMRYAALHECSYVVKQTSK